MNKLIDILQRAGLSKSASYRFLTGEKSKLTLKQLQFIMSQLKDRDIKFFK